VRERGWLLVRSTGYVVTELTPGKFQPEYAGKLNFYIALVDDTLWNGPNPPGGRVSIRLAERSGVGGTRPKETR
jgi:hypothetical protein